MSLMGGDPIAPLASSTVMHYFDHVFVPVCAAELAKPIRRMHGHYHSFKSRGCDNTSRASMSTSSWSRIAEWGPVRHPLSKEFRHDQR